MNLSNQDKQYLTAALDTEIARVKRAGNATSNQAIRDILGQNISDLMELQARVAREATKEGAK